MMENKELIEEVKLLVTEVDTTHRYSMSKIYGLYNKVFQASEVPQSCASCLIRKVKALKEWLAKQEAEELTQKTIQPEAKKKKPGRKPKSKATESSKSE